MDYRTLGRTGVKVSPLCLGAMMFGSFGNPDHDDTIRIIHAALDAGINFVDTADVYSFGESEEIVGKALAQTKRHKVVLATKVHGAMGQDPNAQGNSRRWIMAECENSLRRLGVDYIDLYQIHRPSPDTDIDETLGALTDLVRAGKIRYFGSSTFPAHEIVEAQWVAERRARERFVTEQPPYSILVRGIEKDVLPMCQQYGMGVLSWSPLAGGWLSGAFGSGKENTSRRSAMFCPHHYDMELPGNRAKLEAVDAADASWRTRRGCRLIELALGFVLEHPGVTCPIIGPRTMEHLQSQLPALELRLERRRARPHRRDRAAGHRPQRHRRRLGAGGHRGRLAAPAAQVGEQASFPGTRSARSLPWRSPENDAPPQPATGLGRRTTEVRPTASARSYVQSSTPVVVGVQSTRRSRSGWAMSRNTVLAGAEHQGVDEDPVDVDEVVGDERLRRGPRCPAQ